LNRKDAALSTTKDAKKEGDWRLSTLDKALIAFMLLLALASAVLVLIQPNVGEQLLMLRTLHYWLSRIGLAIALVMLGTAVYIGLAKHGDVTPLFRRATYTIVAFMLIEALVGLAMYALIGARPYDEVHLIYGMGAVLSLPFFIYVEITAKKRPAMGSYIWGFSILAAIIVRLYMTGAAG
jgi:hypothetical protein